MSNQLELIASVFPSQDAAKTLADGLERMHRGTTITLRDMVVVTKNEDGKLDAEETREVTGRKGFKRGALLGGAFAVLFPPSLLAGILAGGAVGGAWGKIRDTGIKTKVLEDLGDSLRPGAAAVVVLAEPAYGSEIRLAMDSGGGELIRDQEGQDASPN